MAFPLHFEKRVLRLIQSVSPGTVATYGQIAALAGFPRHARHVGRLLSGLPSQNTIPWHRVINAKGEISLRQPALSGESALSRQARLLQKEGVEVKNGKISLRKFRWNPETTSLF